MRMMSFALTPDQLLDGSKTVTRRVGWANLKPGERITAVRKAMGLKAGESPDVLCEIEVVSVRRERLDAIDADDCAAEGFPYLTPERFVAMFCEHMTVVVPDEGHYKGNVFIPRRRKMTPADVVTRIEFRKVPGSERGTPVQTRLAV